MKNLVVIQGEKRRQNCAKSQTCLLAILLDTNMET
jgi:hypothetical protein